MIEAAAQPAAVVTPVAVAAAPVSPPASSQYHAQDELGQYNYGYSTPESSKVETKTADGIVRGSYTYIDADGRLQTVQYISDALGFRVAGTNVPVHVVPEEHVATPAYEAAYVEETPVVTYAVDQTTYPEVPESAPAVEEHPAVTYEVAAPVEAIKSEVVAAQPIVTPQVAYSYLPYATQYQYLIEPGKLYLT